MLTLLPECLAKAVLCEWLEADAVKLLDTAYCVREWRDTMLNLLTGQVISKVNNLRKSVVVWMLRRKIKSRDFLVCGYQCEEYVDLIVKLMKRSATSICSFHISNESPRRQIQYEVLKRCFQLTMFSSDNICAPELHKILLNNHNSINVLDVRCARTTVPQSQYALEELPKLHRLRVTLIQSCCAVLLSEVLVKAGCLQTLCVAVNHQEVLFTFSTPCPRLQNLKLNTQEDLRITNLVTNCQHIVNLDLQYCFNLRDDDILAAAKHLHHLRS